MLKQIGKVILVSLRNMKIVRALPLRKIKRPFNALDVRFGFGHVGKGGAKAISRSLNVERP